MRLFLTLGILLVVQLLPAVKPSWAGDLPSFLPPGPLAEEVIFVEPFAELGERYQFEVLEHRFEVVNHAKVSVRILSVVPIAEAARAFALPEVLPPGGRGEIRVFQPVGNKLGEANFRFKVETDYEQARERKLALRCFVQSAFDPEMERIDFGEVDPSQGASREIELATRENDLPLELLGLEDAPPWLSIESVAGTADGQGLRVGLKLDGLVPLGAQVGLFRLRTNLAKQSRFEISFRLQAAGRLVPSQPSLDFAWLRLGQKVTRELLLRSRDGLDFSIDSVTTGHPDLKVSESECGQGCRRLLAELEGTQIGNQVGTLEIRAAGELLPLPWAALVVAPSTQVKEITAALEGLATGDGESSRGPSTPAADVVRQPSPGQEPAVARREITLSWKARQEDQVYGYLVYRSNSRSGPFYRHSSAIVRAKAETPGLASTYHYVDREVEAGRTYYYYLDVVSKSGRKQRFSGVLSRQVAADALP